MSKVYRCIDCGKEFEIDFTAEFNEKPENLKTEEFRRKISEHIKALNFPSECNICLDCLKAIKFQANSSIKTNEKNNLETISKEYIDQFNKNFKNEEKNLNKYTLDLEQKELKELNDLKSKVDKNESELNLLLKELEKVENKETEFCNEFRDLEIKLYFVQKELSKSNDLKLDYENKIQNFSNNNIFTELFQISFNEKFGSINGCKFCDPYISNNYDSINGGWGYIILLTKLLAVKFMFESNKYELIPEGNFSKIINKVSNLEYEVDISDINRTKDKFNRAMDAYMDYLTEFLNFLIKKEKIKINKSFPKIEGNKINDLSIQIDNEKNNLEKWYKCMRYLLSILKFLICEVLKEEEQFYKGKIDDINNINDKDKDKNLNKIITNK